MAQETLLTYLQKQGIISPPDVTKVQLETARSPKNEETVIREMGLANNEQIAQAKSALFNIPFVNLMEAKVLDSVLSEVPIDSLKKHRVVPFEREETSVKLAMLDPFDVQATQAIQRSYPLIQELTYISLLRRVSTLSWIGEWEKL